MYQIARIGLKLMAVVALCCAAAGNVLDLGDIAAGGNGTGTGQHGRGIRAYNGTAVPPNQWGGEWYGGAVFTRTDGANGTANLPFVDGVFRPRQTTQISSTGLSYAFDNNGADSWDAIRNGLAVVAPDGTPTTIQLNDQPGVNRPGLGMHANSGITFDLNKLRAAGYAFDGVRGVAGLNSDSNGYTADVEAWVIVDGTLRYHQRFTEGGRVWQAFSAPLSAGDRFLTLTSTGVNGINSDHTVFADAALVPEPACALLFAAAALVVRRR